MSQHYRCPLGRLQSKQFDKDKIKQSGWQHDGILVVHANDDRLTWVEKELVQQLGDKLYGQKREA